MTALFNLVEFSTPTTGTGTITVGAAIPGRRTPAQASVPDGSSVSYSISDGTAYEYGHGTIGGSGTTLTRGPLGSSSGGAALALSGNARVALVLLAEDLASLSSGTNLLTQLDHADYNITSPDAWVYHAPTWFRDVPVSIGNQAPQSAVRLHMQSALYNPTDWTTAQYLLVVPYIDTVCNAGVTGGSFGINPGGDYNYQQGLTALQGQVQPGGTGIVFTAYGVIGTIYNTGAGRIVQAWATQGGIQNLNASGTIDDARCLYAATGFNQGGAITNWYGVYVDPPPAPNAPTNSWGVYVAGDTPSWFGGQVRTSPSTAARSGISIPSGAAPTSPVDGDVWNDGAAINVRIGSATQVLGVRKQRAVTASPIVVNPTDNIINCNIAGTASCTLPLASSRSGRPVTFKDLGQAAAHPITITTTSPDLIDGLPSFVLSNNYAAITLVPFNDGVNAGWSIQ
jgi:hypothetical protein